MIATTLLPSKPEKVQNAVKAVRKEMWNDELHSAPKNMWGKELEWLLEKSYQER